MKITSVYLQQGEVMVAVPVEKPKWQGLLRAKQQQWQIRLTIMGDVSLCQNLYTAVFPPSALP